MDLFKKWLESRGYKYEDLSESKRAEMNAQFEREMSELIAQRQAPTAPAPQPPAAPVAPATESRTTQDFAAQVRSLAPRSLKTETVDTIVVECAGDLESAKKRMLEEHAKAAAPVGTPEPTEPEGTRTEGNGDNREDKLRQNLPEEMRGLSDEELSQTIVRSAMC